MLFVLFLYACTAAPLHPTARFDSLCDVVSVSHLPSASSGHVGCRVTCSLCHQEVWCQSSPAVCIARVSVAALAPVPLYIMDFALYELHLQIIWLEFCWHWLPHSLGVMYLHLWENTFPFFFPKGFLGFSYQADTPQISASPHRPKQGLRLVIIIIVFCPGKLTGCPVYFFHDLGRIHASLFRIPRCSKLMSLGLVVLILSLTSAPLAWLSPQVWLARSTCVLGLRQSNWQF